MPPEDPTVTPPAAPAVEQPPAVPPATGAPTATAHAEADPGFPAGTPWREMQPEQQVAYWQHQARRHEGRSYEALGLKSADELAQLRKDAADAAELRKAQMTDHELAIAAARDSAATETRKEFGRELALAAFEAASAGRVTADVLAELKIDPVAYLGEDGRPDRAAVAAAAARLAPAPHQPPLNTGGGSSGGLSTVDEQASAALAAGDIGRSIALKVATARP